MPDTCPTSLRGMGSLCIANSRITLARSSRMFVFLLNSRNIRTSGPAGLVSFRSGNSTGACVVLVAA